MSDETEDQQRENRRGTNPASLATLAENRAATQFGGERGNASNMGSDGAQTKPYSVRNAVRHIAAQEIDMETKDSFKKLLPKKPTVAQVIAANALAKATKGDMRAVEYVTEQIDGKLAQPNLNADLAALESMTDEQLYDIINRFNAAHSLTGAGISSDAGDSEPTGSQTPA